jgi:hypothetical protein
MRTVSLRMRRTAATRPSQVSSLLRPSHWAFPGVIQTLSISLRASTASRSLHCQSVAAMPVMLGRRCCMSSELGPIACSGSELSIPRARDRAGPMYHHQHTSV